MSRKTSVPSSKAPVSGTLSLALGTTPPKPHGYCVISSEWASTKTLTVRPFFFGLVTFRPRSAPRRPSGATSVRSSCIPSTDGNAYRT